MQVYNTPQGLRNKNFKTIKSTTRYRTILNVVKLSVIVVQKRENDSFVYAKLKTTKKILLAAMKRNIISHCELNIKKNILKCDLFIYKTFGEIDFYLLGLESINIFFFCNLTVVKK